MPREKINDTADGGCYAQVSWRRDGVVQVATINDQFGAREDGWRVTLDEASIDRLIKALHKAKNQAFGPSPEAVARAEAMIGYGYSNEEISRLSGLSEVTVESDATAAARLDVDRYRATRRGDR